MKIKTSCSSRRFTTDRISLAFGDAYHNEVSIYYAFRSSYLTYSFEEIDKISVRPFPFRGVNFCIIPLACKKVIFFYSQNFYTLLCLHVDSLPFNIFSALCLCQHVTPDVNSPSVGLMVTFANLVFHPGFTHNISPTGLEEEMPFFFLKKKKNESCYKMLHLLV